jgi:hypothetical protein
MEEKKKENYTPISGYNVITSIIREQNIILLNKIADTMSLNDLKREELIDEFLKVNYYTPRVIFSKKRENIQNLFARNTVK